jgi:hypothetical protein
MSRSLICLALGCILAQPLGLLAEQASTSSAPPPVVEQAIGKDGQTEVRSPLFSGCRVPDPSELSPEQLEASQALEKWEARHPEWVGPLDWRITCN